MRSWFNCSNEAWFTLLEGDGEVEVVSLLSIEMENAFGIQFLKQIAAINREDSSTVAPDPAAPPLLDSQSMIRSKLVR